MILICIVELIILFLFFNSIIQKQHTAIQKMEHESEIQDIWIGNLQRSMFLSRFFKANNISEVVVFGCDHLGETLYHELISNDITVKFFIDDKRNDRLFWHRQVPIINMSEFEKKAAAETIVVAETDMFKALKERLGEDYPGKILCLEDLVRALV
ncbi:MAG: hypothetical protein K6F86_08995 [Lachnospiraceae bacterium]|nr:hypothetical protein [Lachnospiraceae bacterium]